MAFRFGESDPHPKFSDPRGSETTRPFRKIRKAAHDLVLKWLGFDGPKS